MSKREFRSFYCDILENDGFQDLSADAKVTLFTVKLLLGKYGIGRLRIKSLALNVGELNGDLDSALSELGDWLERDSKVWWLVDGLKNEPKGSMNWNTESHINALIDFVELLPESDIVEKFKTKYDTRIPSRFPTRLLSTVVFSSVSLNTSKEIDSGFSPYRFIIKSGDYWQLPNDLYGKLKETYTGIDVNHQLKAASIWCDTNRAKRKTADGMPKFLNSWMNRQKPEPVEPAMITCPKCQGEPPKTINGQVLACANCKGSGRVQS